MRIFLCHNQDSSVLTQMLKVIKNFK